MKLLCPEHLYYVVWWIKPTRWTCAYTLEKQVFNSHEERMNYIYYERKKKLWEYLPFVERVFYFD